MIVPPPQDLSTGKLPVVEDMDEVLRRETRDSLRPLSLGLAALFGLLVVFNALDLPPHARWPVFLHDGVVILFSLIVFRWVRRGQSPLRWTYPICTALALVVTSNVLLTMHLLGAPFYTLYIALILVGVGTFMLSSRWVGATLGLLGTAWALVAAPLVTPRQFAHFTFVLLAASMVAVTLHLSRVRTQRRLSQLGYRDRMRKAELEAALQREAGLRRVADSTVNRRTEELVQVQGELIRELEERERMEEQQRELQAHLQHSQKLESLGKLAGGVAHDFNNLLTVIQGSIDVALLHPDTPEMVVEMLEEGARAGDRAARITAQLLAFGRRQVLNPQVVSLGELVRDLEPLLSRLPGEQIALKIDVDPQAGNLFADPGSIEQVVMNLVLNSRDALSQGGTITVSVTREVVASEGAETVPGCAPGDYLCITVTDDGCGMDEQTCARAFDPFFTTKEVGKGTGLGLATVNGIVSQQGGRVTVESEVGVGSTFRVYLPRVDLEVQPAEGGTEKRPSMQGGHETVLVAEDEPGVRTLAVNLLRKLGYRVLEAEDGVQALEVCRDEPGEVHLLLTDVQMPRMNGRRLVKELRKTRPKVRIIFMSGYVDDLSDAWDSVAPGTNFLSKPFSLEHLAATVRQVLDASEASRKSRASWAGRVVVVPPAS